ncbi:replication protein A 70 kDa DNA-binding subunit A-like [Silene latifolia]|uniref:replication protein A 70 kDa DNA-binding subunit A-like n=1 Tax=Silene latifolia TaxID=37657 RepID=UPI003D76D799
MSLDDRYDVLGVVIYVEQCSQIPRQSGQPLNGRDVVIVDRSHNQVMIVTAWAELTINECEMLHSNAGSFPVVGFTASRPSFQKGFSLSTTHSTFIILDPLGEKANAVRAW